MRRDFGVFVALAVMLHLLATVRVNQGAEAAGADGDARVSLVGANAQAAMMVQEWDRPPELVDMEPVEQPAEPPSETPQTPSQETAAIALPRPDLPSPESPITDQVNVETIQTLSSPSLQIEPTQDVTSETAPPRPETTQLQPPSTVETTFHPPETHVQKMTVPITRPESVARDHPPAARAQPATQALASQQAVGTGGGTDAGTTGNTATVSDGQRAEMQQIWASQIRRAIERRKRYPRKAQSRGERGTATISVTINRAGALLGTTLVSSTGSQLLDSAALNAVSSARLPAAPSELPGNQFSFRFRLVFE